MVVSNENMGGFQWKFRGLQRKYEGFYWVMRVYNKKQKLLNEGIQFLRGLLNITFLIILLTWWIYLAINCTAPYIIPKNGKATMNWTEVNGMSRPYGSIIEYQCTMKGWGYMHNGLSQTISSCLSNGEWNVTDVPSCISKLCFVLFWI